MTARILLIDDDRLQFRLTRAYFDNFVGRAYALDHAETYEAGLAALLSGAYAACLLDYQLGERDGLELIRAAVAAGCRTPIVFLTADSSDAIDVAAMEAGALDYLVKGAITPRLLEKSLRYAIKLGETLGALHRLATHDELTGLLNRREFERLLAEEVERARRFGHSFGLVLADLDHFKSINDRYGHPGGDAVLREAARRLVGAVRSVDRVARLGGEEFAVLLVQTAGDAALTVGRRLVGAMAGSPVDLGEGRTATVTLSAGAAAFPADAAEGAALVAAADRALYAAKAAGRDRVAGVSAAAPAS